MSSHKAAIARAEKALRESETRYERVMLASQAGLWDWDVVKDEYYVSPRMLEICGFPPGTAFSGRGDFMRRVPFFPEDRENYQQAVRRLFAGCGSRLSMEVRELINGETRWFDLEGMCFRDTARRVLHWTGSATDITERKRAEDALRQSEQRYERAMLASRAGYWDWDVVKDQFYVSPRLLEMFGFPPGTSFCGRDDFFRRAPVYAEDREKYQKAVRQLFAGGGSRVAMELRSKTEAHWCHVEGMCFRDAAGKVLRWTGSVTDITERKRAEESLRLSEALLLEAQGLARMGNFAWHVREGDIAWSEQIYRIFEFEPGSRVTLERIATRVHPEDIPTMLDMVDRAQNGASNFEYEQRILMPDGRIKHVHLIAHRALGEEDRLEYIGAVQDITQRKQAEDEMRRLERQLRQAQRLEAMGALAGGIAHDFNNILGAILGYGEMALRNAPEGGRLQRDVEGIMTAGERGRALVDRILAFSRSGVSERVAVHVEQVVREALDLLEAKLPEGIRVEAKLQAGRAAILGDPTQVHQVLMNLGTNAVQAMASGGTLSVSLNTARFDAATAATIGNIEVGEYIALTVADTGIGIPREIIDRIFDPFFSTKEVGIGTGLGLSLVHGIVTGLGGAIDVSSNPGTGSAFTVYLPRAGDAAESPAGEALALPRGRGQRVLVVDNEEPLVRLTTEALEELGYAAVGFTSSLTALDAFRASPEGFDAVVTDERMPDMSGSALIREVRRIRHSIPILLISGYVSGMVMTRAYNEGADEVLKKPLLARDLAITLARVLQR